MAVNGIIFEHLSPKQGLIQTVRVLTGQNISCNSFLNHTLRDGGVQFSVLQTEFLTAVDYYCFGVSKVFE